MPAFLALELVFCRKERLWLAGSVCCEEVNERKMPAMLLISLRLFPNHRS